MAPAPPEAQGWGEDTLPSPGGYTLQDVNFGRLYKAATQTSKRVLRAVFLVVQRRARVVLGAAWPTSVAQYCLQVLAWSNTRFRQSFSAEERLVLQQPLEEADMDVSLLSKLLHKLFQDLPVPEQLWRALRDIKNVRNRVCHKHLLLGEEELTQNLNDLKDMYEALLQQVGEVFAVPVDDLRTTFLAEVDDILSSAVAMEAAQYFDKVQQFRMQLVGRFIAQAQRELMQRYSRLQVLNPFTWLSSSTFPQLQVGSIFTPLLMTLHSREVQVAELLTLHAPSEDSGAECATPPDVTVLAGIAGCGKTSLCRFLLHEWRTHGGAVASLRGVDILLHIEARNVTSPSLVTFLQKTLLADTCSHFEEKDVVQALRHVSVLYVVDGLDEATQDAKQLVRDVFSMGVTGEARVLLTTRPEYLADVRQLAEQHQLAHLKLAIHGFSEQGRKAFVSRVFAAFERDEALRRRQEAEFLDLLSTACRELSGHLRLPLTLSLLVCLWRDDKTRLANITSATRLYHEIFRLCCAKMATRLRGSAAPHPLELQGFVDEWLLALGRAAYALLEEGKLLLDEKTRRRLAGLCEGKGVSSLQLFSAFLQCEVQESLTGVQHHYYFVHKSQMEYLAALYLSHEVMDAARGGGGGGTVKEKLQGFRVFRNSLRRENRRDIHDIILFSGWGARWANTWLFLVGHLCLQGAADHVLEVVLDAILSVPAVTRIEATMWRLVEESGRHPLVRERVGAAMLPDYSWRPSETELCDAASPMARLLLHTSFTPSSLVLRVVGGLGGALTLGEDGRLHTTPYHNLAPILTCLAQRPTCYIYFKLDQHFYTWGATETADHLLQLLQPQGSLVSFTGYVGPAGAKALSFVKEMSELNVRVSAAATLQALTEGVLAPPSRVLRVMVRLDLPWDALPRALPRLHTPLLDIVLRSVQDATAAAAATALGQLSLAFCQVELVAARLTPEGAETLLKELKERDVTIKEALTVRSTHPLQEEERGTLQALLGGGDLHWWC